ncbi:uncharacterized protein LOC123705971 [Colias croceus]|uniref:uncharacterized protein LOC123705971 n=1 Tax=Colias crocea TaxID=72248 RepID=UPI001E280984|nr:uncharacterized protein LOC123705971 [Colias croceus]
MPPKPKETVKKPTPQVARPNVSDASLNYVPEDAVEGYQDRIENGINWTLSDNAGRYHRKKCLQENIPQLSFSTALQNKINKSILRGFFDETNTLSLEEQWEIMLPITLWDNEKFANEEGKICFNNCNCITDNMIQLIKKAVKINDRKCLKEDLKRVTVLRVNDIEMTELDAELLEFKNLITLNLACNFIDKIDASFLPPGLKLLELQANRINNLDHFTEHLPTELIYLGLSRNLLNDEGIQGVARLPHHITVLDLADNDIYDLNSVLEPLAQLPCLTSLQLAGNPCSVCAAYARTTLTRFPRLQWLDCREVLPTDRSAEPFEPHPDDLRSAYFDFTVFRVISVPQPPKPEKGATTAFHIELELPLLDSTRRQFLMFRQNESLIEMMPPPEDEDWNFSKQASAVESKMILEPEASSHASDIYNRLTTKNSRIICHYTTFESNKVQWNKIMNFQEPTVRIFCPNLTALRDTFRTVVTIRLIYSMTFAGKPGKPDKKSAMSLKPPGEQRVTLATIKCALKRPDWSQPQHFHWDDSLGTEDAIHWGDGDLSVLQYSLGAVKTAKGKPENDPSSSRQLPPDNLTCHFGFSIDTVRS